MYAAKSRTTLMQVYEASLDSSSSETLSMLSELRNAVAQGELRLFLQPKINLATGQVSAAEALVRWQHPQRGLVPPLEFIPFAEQTGFVRQLTMWMFEESARVSKTLAGLEITESAIMDDPQRAQSTLNLLSERGFKLSIDDFGTGYSSLAYLKSLPVDELKIDKSFVMNMETDEDDAKIVRSTVDLAHNLGLTVVAEGVENALIWDKLKALNCDEAQGYFMSKPLAASGFAAWCEGWAAKQEKSA